MTHEEIIAMAREEGLSFVPDTNSPWARIVRKAVAKERESCAQVCDASVKEWLRLDGPHHELTEAQMLADEIRARGQKGGRMTRIYIAGPMSGLPELNYPAFNAMAERLRAHGHHVENPAENPPPKCESWLGYMRMAVAQLATCDAVVMLPGWSKSKGACIEHQLAVGLGLEIVEAGNV